ncbi:DUF1642 domain-containing protein [Streptococcus mitis]|uniref:DUF1642 domain-containing protein n=1 Tax=Streptococcus mitis TaxID=28037 RepID=UPI001CBA802D|nr:DUF1642 domain-containing protein [Streptococcus mitis]MBZ2107712.1 DUF1642 domain-containing protein [Streptococcus mitis]
MKLKELIEKFEERKTIIGNYQGYAVWWEDVKEIFEQLDEPETGHADEAPRYLKNMLARLRELPVHNREVWLKVIMSEFKQDFSHAKWREGYEQGKLEGMVEREKVKVPQFVADWISFVKTNGLKFKNTYGFYEEIAPSDDVYRVMYYIFKESIADKEIRKWVADNIDTFARAWLDGYEVEKEKRYLVKIKATKHYIAKDGIGKIFFSLAYKESFTKKELEEAGFGWVFDCEGIEIEEVTK